MQIEPFHIYPWN